MRSGLDSTAFGKPHPLALGAAVSVIIVILLAAVAISGVLSGARPEKSEASAPRRQPVAEVTVPAGASICASCGTVDAVRVVEARGKDNTVLPILGAAFGALAGNEIGKNVHRRASYRVIVRMDDGSFRTVSQSTVPTVAVGDRVRIANGALAARSVD